MASLNSALGPEYDKLVAVADSMDMAVLPMMRALVAGAFDRGLLDSCVMHAIERGLVPAPSRRPRPRLRWESDGENWHYQEWTLVRQGNPAHGTNTAGRKPTDGWYLHGPGHESGTFLDTMAAAVAKDIANDLVFQYQERQAG